MKLFWRFIRTDVKKSKRNFVLFGCTIFLGVIAIVISLLLTRTGKLLYQIMAIMMLLSVK